MKRTVTALCLLAGVLSVTSAFALDLQRKGPDRTSGSHVNLNRAQTAYGCDDGIFYNAYFQDTNWRLGNVFDFGGGSLLSEVAFAHFGYGFSGPYNYNLEVWDPASCTKVAGVNGLVAADAANDVMVEDIPLCQNNLFLAGNLVVAIDPNSCLAANDCYPDLLFDDQLDVECPVIIANASTTPSCVDVAANSGPFLLRVALNECPTPARPHSWGQVKAIYR